ncbi:MAG: hypothetical protein ABIR54_24080 [Burkholderiaceae bacterium]
MDQREFEAVVDEFSANAKDLVELVEQARYEQPTAIEISRLLDGREDLLAVIAKLPALRSVSPPVDIPVHLASLRKGIVAARAALKTSPDSTAILQMVIDVGETFATTIAPLQAAGRWPKSRSR